MCGICGMVRAKSGESADPALVERMNAALLHRGPDEGGVWSEGPAALGARRLSIIDVEHGQQPITTEDGRFTVAFNGEIYNADEIRAELEAQGQTFKTRCDTEVVLHACARHGAEAAKRFNGMFAYACYDRQTNRLILVRDRLGIKPLYVMERNGALYFASELDALLRSGQVDGTLDAAALDAYFTYLYVPEPETIFQGVCQLRPGECLTWEKGRATREAYWTPSFEADPSWTLDSAAERYRELLHDAVRLQQVSDVPLGAFLSGGMDSASVVAALSETSSGRVKTFTIGFDEPEADERGFAEDIAKRFDTDHTSEVMNPDPVEVLPQLIEHFGQPFADSSAIPTWLVSKLARESVTVVLSGDGGDELFAGYSWLHMNRKVDTYRRTPAALRHLADFCLQRLPGGPSLEKLRHFSADSFYSPMESFRRRQSCFYPGERLALYKPDLTNALARTARDRFAEHWDNAAGLSDDDRMLRQDLRMYLPGDILTKVDRMSMAVSLEARVPLLDHRLVEFAGSLPFHLKYDGRVSKRVVKRAFGHLLPESVLKQRKRGFSIPVDRWFRGELSGYFQDTVMAHDSLAREWLDEAEIESIWNVHRSGERNLGHRLWSLLAFELWLRYVSKHTKVSLG